MRFASGRMQVPPPASTVFWMFGLSCAAQRGCWKLFHDTPTVQAPAAALLPPPVLAAGAAVPAVLEQAAKMTAATATSPANLRFAMLSIPPQWDLTDPSVHVSRARLPPSQGGIRNGMNEQSTDLADCWVLPRAADRPGTWTAHDDPSRSVA